MSQDLTPMTSRPRFIKCWYDERDIPYNKKKAFLDPETGEKEIREVPMMKSVKRLMITYIPNPHDQHGKTEIDKAWSDLVPRAELENANTFEAMAVNMRYRALKPHVDAYKEGALVDRAEGTPLTNVRGVTEAVANLLRKQEIFTAEQLADAPEIAIRRVQHPEIRQFVRQARETLTKHTAVAEAVSAATKEQSERFAKLEAENAALRQMMTEFLESQKAAANGDARKTHAKPATKETAHAA